MVWLRTKYYPCLNFNDLRRGGFMARKYTFRIFVLFFWMPFLHTMEDDTVALNDGFFVAANHEADIAGLAKKLVSEAEGHHSPTPPPANMQQLPQDKALELWVEWQSRPSEQKRLNRIFRIIEDNNQQPVFIESTQNVIPEIVLRELDVLVGSGIDQQQRRHCLARQIDNTILHIGYATLARNLVQTKKNAELQNLQTAIRQLNKKSSNKSLHELVRKHLVGLKNYEDNFLSFWINQEQQEALEEMQKHDEFRNLPCGFSEKANESSFVVTLQKLTDFSLPVITPLATIAIGVASGVITGGNPLVIAQAGIGSVFSLKNIPQTYRSLKVKTMALHLMQKKLIGLRVFVDKLKGIRNLLTSSQMNIPAALTDKLELPTVGPQMKKLTSLLAQNTFKSQPSFWSHWGKICVAYRLMLKKRNEFVGAYLGLGTIDFIASLNTLLKSSIERAPYCLATYTPDLKLDAEKCWSPLIDRQAVVANDVCLGGEKQTALVITGPNARGKTTIMRSVGAASLLASTIGIAPAKTIVVPSNLLFLTSINVGDDPSRNLSLFAAVTKRMGDIMKALKNRPNRPHLVISDEPFVGTDRNLAETCAQELIRSVALCKKALSLFSSHFNVTCLEQEMPKLIANYHVAQGYKFIRGVDPHPEQYNNVALDIIAKAFGEESGFVEKVRAKLKK